MMKKVLQILWIPLLIFILIREFNREPVVKVVEVIKEVPTEIVKEKSGLKLIKSSYSDLANWKKDNIEEAGKAFADSCLKIREEKGEFLSTSEIKIPTKYYKEICNDFLSYSGNLRDFIEKNFTPYLVTDNGDEKGKFTSYYESRINASYTQSDKYKYPIHGRPLDLIEVRLKDFDPDLPNKTIVGRLEKNKLVKYYTRSEIYKYNINAPTILWVDDYVDVYVMQIQGSAVAHMEDGSDIRVGYADNNGHPFKGIGSILLENKLIKPGEASMGKIKKWLKENGDVAVKNMLLNNRYIFHRIVDAEGPIGAQGVPLRPGRSMAVDKNYIPLGSLIWLETTGPSKEKIEKLVVAQDIGGAIKGAVRGDYFWGSGNDEVLEYAGKMNSAGRYFILIPKNVEIK